LIFQPQQIVLVDTNVIIETHRTGCWNSLANFFHLETVETCVVETQTGYQNRSPEQTISDALLRQQLKNIANISEIQKAEFFINYKNAPALDEGELHLLIHALTRNDKWLINSPDLAAMRFACKNGFDERLISLETMVRRVKAQLAAPLQPQYTEAWQTHKKTQMLLGM